MNKEARPVVFILATWLCLALAVGKAGWFRGASAPVVALTVWTLTAAALIACWKNGEVRAWWGTADLRNLIALHLTRFIGLYFLFLCKRGDLPEGFALPAGIGDVLIAAGALIILVIPELIHSRAILLSWNVLGLIDIMFVVFTALRLGLRDWSSMAPLRTLPLSLLPTFLVPLIITSHVLIFIRLRPANTR